MYSVYQVTIQPNIATQYTKHRKKCVCSKWEIYNDWHGEKELHMPVFFVGENIFALKFVNNNSIFLLNDSNGKTHKYEL